MIEDFFFNVVQWASGQPDVLAVALVGSYARGTATPTSDIDLVVLTARPQKYLGDTEWVNNFDEAAQVQFEDWGKVTSVRVWYTNGREVEFGITTAEWAAEPLDAGTREVVANGFKVLFDRASYLDAITSSVT